MEIPLIPNKHILKVTTLGPTNQLPCRVKITSERFKQSIVIPFTNHAGASNPAIDTATLYLIKKGFKIESKGEGKDNYYLVCDTFDPIK